MLPRWRSCRNGADAALVGEDIERLPVYFLFLKMAASQQETGTFSVIRRVQLQLSGCDSDVRAADYNSQVTEMTLSGDFSTPPPPPQLHSDSDTPTSHLLSISLAQ